MIWLIKVLFNAEIIYNVSEKNITLDIKEGMYKIMYMFLTPPPPTTLPGGGKLWRDKKLLVTKYKYVFKF